jgi:hypothetical protein
LTSASTSASKFARLHVARVPAADVVGAEADADAGEGAGLSTCGVAKAESSPPPPQPAKASSAINATKHENFDFIGDEDIWTLLALLF